MKLKTITAMAIAAFLVVLLYFLVAGYLLSHPSKKPSPATISGEVKAAKSGLFNPPKPAIVH